MEEALTTLLASVASGHRYWSRKPQDVSAVPYVVMHRISGVPDYVMSGPGGYIASRVQLDCYGKTYTSARATARAVKTILSGYSGGGIQGVFIDAERDLTDADAGEVTNLFVVSLDIIIHHEE